jgi:lysozyme
MQYPATDVANEFNKWVYAGGKVLPGLVRRRAAEKALFLTGV